MEYIPCINRLRTYLDCPSEKRYNSPCVKYAAFEDALMFVFCSS
jgi:hypothetical protein